MRQGLVAILLLLSGVGAAAQDSVGAGADIFNGTGSPAGTVSIGASSVVQPIVQFPCRACHGRDGLGGGESDAPPIEWKLLSASTELRAGYDLELFQQLLEQGVKSNGSNTDQLMPRYRLPKESIVSLAAYLEALAGVQKRGIDSGEVRLGVVAPTDNLEVARAYAALLEAELLAQTGARPIYNRSVKVKLIGGAPGGIVEVAQANYAAVVGLAPSRLISAADLVAEGVPVIFPLFPLEIKDASLVRGLIAEPGVVLAKTLEQMKAQGFRKVAIVKIGESAMDYLPSVAGLEIVSVESGGVAPGDIDAALITGDDDKKVSSEIRRIPPDMPIFAIGGELPSLPLVELEQRHSLTLANPFGHLGDPKSGLLRNHARATAALIVFALRKAGHDGLSRSTLVRAFDREVFGAEGLNYADFPASGPSAVDFLAIASVEKLNRPVLQRQ